MTRKAALLFFAIGQKRKEGDDDSFLIKEKI